MPHQKGSSKTVEIFGQGFLIGLGDVLRSIHSSEVLCQQHPPQPVAIQEPQAKATPQKKSWAAASEKEWPSHHCALWG
eukprot:691302-Amphidinium_carterae.1